MIRRGRTVDCPDCVLGWIPWYADGELNAREKTAVEAHAEECVDCREEFDLVRGTSLEAGLDSPDADRLFEKIMLQIDLRRHVREVRGSGSESVGSNDAGRMG